MFVKREKQADWWAFQVRIAGAPALPYVEGLVHWCNTAEQAHEDGVSWVSMAHVWGHCCRTGFPRPDGRVWICDEGHDEAAGEVRGYVLDCWVHGEALREAMEQVIHDLLRFGLAVAVEIEPGKGG